VQNALAAEVGDLGRVQAGDLSQDGVGVGAELGAGLITPRPPSASRQGSAEVH
jgi:hypothetical protein